MTMFTLASPWILLLIPLPWIVRYILPRANQKQRALKIPFYADLLTVTADVKQTYFISIIKKTFSFFIWCLLVFAASGPLLLGESIPLPRQGRDIMLAVDISGSMQLPDMILDGREVSRLDAVKKVGLNFIAQRQGDRLGLILFGSRAYLQTPLTFDTKTVQNMLSDATIGLAGMQTAIGDAIGLAIKRLLEAPEKSRVLILLTDGGNNSGTVSPDAAAELAAKNGIRIYTIGFGADEMTISGVFGPQFVNPSVDLDEESLEKIATITNGHYFRAKDTETLTQVYDFINTLEPVNHEQQLFRPKIPLYPWPLGFALLLSVLLALHSLLKKWRFQYTKINPMWASE